MSHTVRMVSDSSKSYLCQTIYWCPKSLGKRVTFLVWRAPGANWTLLILVCQMNKSFGTCAKNLTVKDTLSFKQIWALTVTTLRLTCAVGNQMELFVGFTIRTCAILVTRKMPFVAIPSRRRTNQRNIGLLNLALGTVKSWQSAPDFRSRMLQTRKIKSVFLLPR